MKPIIAGIGERDQEKRHLTCLFPCERHVQEVRGRAISETRMVELRAVVIMSC